MLTSTRFVSSVVTTTKRAMSYIPKNRLEGKVAVVTASTEGIGYGIAERLAKEGAKVVISSRKKANVDSALNKLKTQGLDVIGTPCHVGKEDQRKQMFELAEKTFGGIDILVSNAAANPTIGGVTECSEEAWDKIFDINVKSSFLLAKEAVPYLRKRGGGNIIFISSITGLQPANLIGAYSVSKTALLGLTKAAAQELAISNIRVNCIAPGFIETKFSDPLINTAAGQEILNLTPMNRFGKLDDVSGVAAFLVSDDAKYITGETVVTAGGMPSRL